MYNWSVWAGLALLVSLAAGCSTSQEIRHYQLHLAPAPSERASTSTGVVLALDPFVTDAAYDDQRMVYRTSLYRLDYYHYHRWSASPGMMVTDYLRRAYSDLGVFEAVVSGYSSLSHVVLSGRVVALEEVDLEPTQWIARVTLELQLRETASGRLIWSRSYGEEQTMDQRTPEGLATALSVAMTRIVKRSALEIVEAAKNTSRGGQP
ncbi:MAG: membrane integrity-associated transporter subunit PqiC [Bradymonadaceae bacterium]|nr:membrane integrity-associated transporter subunit PqiC [Lujinxingiaceae bacterium]